MTALVIRSVADDSVLKRIDVSGKTQAQISRIESGLAINFDFDRFYWTEEENTPEETAAAMLREAMPGVPVQTSTPAALSR